MGRVFDVNEDFLHVLGGLIYFTMIVVEDVWLEGQVVIIVLGEESLPICGGLARALGLMTTALRFGGWSSSCGG
jgi:hypothetical protein